MAFPKKLVYLSRLDLEVVDGGPGRDSYLFQFFALFSLSLFFFFLFFLVAEFVETDYFRDRGFGVRRNLDEVKPFFCGKSKSFFGFQDAEAFSLLVDDS
ncbi:MAG: hypothetical protein UX42_C0027G0008 [Microgenomates group bacterium GW2011_GWC1_46_20]|nr:MAG: hypothetical protein UX42_C0027G0008 [Microgenomates group bacterium GW2011_GWC1_46_20]